MYLHDLAHTLYFKNVKKQYDGQDLNETSIKSLSHSFSQFKMLPLLSDEQITDLQDKAIFKEISMPEMQAKVGKEIAKIWMNDLGIVEALDKPENHENQDIEGDEQPKAETPVEAIVEEKPSPDAPWTDNLEGSDVEVAESEEEENNAMAAANAAEVESTLQDPKDAA